MGKKQTTSSKSGNVSKRSGRAIRAPARHSPTEEDERPQLEKHDDMTQSVLHILVPCVGVIAVLVQAAQRHNDYADFYQGGLSGCADCTALGL